MANPGLIKTYDASGAIAAYSIVKFTATDFQVAKATAATDKFAGVTTEIAAADTERVDVIHDGIAYLRAGGDVAAGDPLTADSNGYAVVAAPAATSTVTIIGHARQAGASGDVIEAIISLGHLSNAANS